MTIYLSRDYYALVVAEQKCFQKGKQTTRSVVAGVVTRIDLLNFIARVSQQLSILLLYLSILSKYSSCGLINVVSPSSSSF